MNYIPNHILEQAQQCKSKSEFRNKYNYTFLLAKENNWLNSLFPPQEPQVKLPKLKKIVLTKEQCIEIARQYTTKTDLNNNNPSIYNKILKNKWGDETFAHMVNPLKIWTLELCQIEALKYNTKKEFHENNKAAYSIAHRYKWMDIISQHMITIGNKYKRCIYAYEFSDNHVYIGLTFNIKHRHKNRFKNKNDAVKKYIEKTNINPVLIQLTEYISVEEAQKLEAHYIEQYKNNNWTVLNVAKAGSIGGKIPILYTSEQKEIIINLYKNGISLSKIHNHINFISSRKTIRDILIENNIKLNKTKLIWNYDNCKLEAQKYVNKTSFRKLSPSAYQSAINHGWYDDITSHFIPTNISINYNDYNLCKSEALKYSTRTNFQKNNQSAYKYSKKNKWLDDFFPIIENSHGYYTNYNNCKLAASNCTSLKEFREKYPNAYSQSLINNWISDFNLNSINKKDITFEQFKELASSCTGRWDFNKKYSERISKKCRDNGWYDIVFPVKPRLVITLDNCKLAAADCQSRLEFHQKFPSLYNYCNKKKWLNDVCSHLPIRMKKNI